MVLTQSILLGLDTVKERNPIDGGGYPTKGESSGDVSRFVQEDPR